MLHAHSHPDSAGDVPLSHQNIASRSYHYARSNRSSRAKVDRDEVYAVGSFKKVYLGVYTEGPRHGQRCVVKVLKDDTDLSEALDVELKLNLRTQQIIDGFNRQGVIDKKILLNRPEPWRWEAGADEAGKMCIAEPMIYPFFKFNSNTGWMNKDDDTDWPEVMQAVTHYSYFLSGGSQLLCDLQGGFTEEGVVITDPAISSNDSRYGNTDLGKKGIEAVMSHHKCNKYCRPAWKRPTNRHTDIPMRHGTSMRSDDGYLMCGAGEHVRSFAKEEDYNGGRGGRGGYGRNGYDDRDRYGGGGYGGGGGGRRGGGGYGGGGMGPPPPRSFYHGEDGGGGFVGRARRHRYEEDDEPAEVIPIPLPQLPKTEPGQLAAAPSLNVNARFQYCSRDG